MDDTQRLLVSFEARMTKYEKDLARTITGTRTGFRKMEKQAEETAVRMDKVMGGALKSFGKGLVGGIIGGLSVAGINKLVADVGKVAEEVANIGSNAKRAGMEVKAFQELSHVAEMNRISVDALTDGMKELQLRADEFVLTGKGSAAEAFQRLGEGPLAGLFGGKPAGFGGGGGKSKAGGGILGALLGFAEGGYTGPGPKHQPAGVVHAGEVVWSQKDVRRAGGVAAVEAMRLGMRGYAGGGVVGQPPTIPRIQAPANQNIAQPIQINAPVTVNGSAGTPAQNDDLARKMAREMEISMRTVVADEVRRQARPGNFLNKRGR